MQGTAREDDDRVGWGGKTLGHHYILSPKYQIPKYCIMNENIKTGNSTETVSPT